jgi:hypothetical protein
MMAQKEIDLSKMTVEDLFRAKQERRQRLAQLSFEQKIEIVKKLQSVSRAARQSAEIPKNETSPREN